MSWLRFIISGFLIASIPWVASHTSNRIAGYLLAHGNAATVEMIEGSLIALPSLLIFGLVPTIILCIFGWSLALFAINRLAT